MRPIITDDIVVSQNDRSAVSSCDPDDDMKKRKKRIRKEARLKGLKSNAAGGDSSKSALHKFFHHFDSMGSDLQRFMTRLRLILWGSVAMILVIGLGLLSWSLIMDSKTENGSGLVSQLMGIHALDSSAALGFRLQDVLISGRQITSLDDIKLIIEPAIGGPIMGLDLKEIRQSLEALPSVHRVAVKRTLPSSLHIGLEERVAVAIWQNDTDYTLIDRGGQALPGDVSLMSHLIVLGGEDAPKHVGILLDMLKTEPSLAKRVKAAVRVGNRRWNLLLDRVEQGVEVRLPEINPEQAWQRLARLEKDSSLSGQSVGMIDLRQPDRMVLNAMTFSSSSNVEGRD